MQKVTVWSFNSGGSEPVTWRRIVRFVDGWWREARGLCTSLLQRGSLDRGRLSPLPFGICFELQTVTNSWCVPNTRRILKTGWFFSLRNIYFALKWIHSVLIHDSFIEISLKYFVSFPLLKFVFICLIKQGMICYFLWVRLSLVLVFTVRAEGRWEKLNFSSSLRTWDWRMRKDVVAAKCQIELAFLISWSRIDPTVLECNAAALKRKCRVAFNDKSAAERDKNKPRFVTVQWIMEL